MTTNEMLALLCPAADLDAEKARMERSLALYALFFPLDRLPPLRDDQRQRLAQAIAGHSSLFQFDRVWRGVPGNNAKG